MEATVTDGVEGMKETGLRAVGDDGVEPGIGGSLSSSRAGVGDTGFGVVEWSRFRVACPELFPGRPVVCEEETVPLLDL